MKKATSTICAPSWATTSRSRPSGKASFRSRTARSSPGSPGVTTRWRKAKKPLAVANLSSPAAQERSSVYGQGLAKIRRDRRLGVRSIQRRQTRRRGGAQRLLFLPRDRQSSRLYLQPLRPLMSRVMGCHLTTIIGEKHGEGDIRQRAHRTSDDRSV